MGSGDSKFILVANDGLSWLAQATNDSGNEWVMVISTKIIPKRWHQPSHLVVSAKDIPTKDIRNKRQLSSLVVSANNIPRKSKESSYLAIIYQYNIPTKVYQDARLIVDVPIAGLCWRNATNLRSILGDQKMHSGTTWDLKNRSVRLHHLVMIDLDQWWLISG